MIENKIKQSKDTDSKRPPEYRYLERIIINRLDRYFGIENKNQERISFPKLKDWWLNIPDNLIEKMNNDEATLLLIALAPHLQPDLFDNIIESRIPHSAELRVIGGVRGKNFRGFLPTGETALFIIAGEDLKKRFQVQKLLDHDGFLARQMLLWLEEPPAGEPVISGKLIVSQEYTELLTFGIVSRPKFGINFPAQFLETQQEWEDLVLPEETMEQVEELQIWIRYNDTLLNEWGMSRKLMPGYKVLFYGPPGTGKTMTASLLGKYTERDVYKIDLSMVVSKFIGETEKNLAILFDKAENKDWILFFDEADALFGKRTSVRDAHDKYANQEVSYLLQKIENYNGLVILASNFKNNIDDAFIRRFQSQIFFPIPKYEERLKIWKKAFPEKLIIEEGEIDISSIARQYELTGSNIMNIVHYACLKTIASESNKLSGKVLLNGIKKEFRKEGKIL